MYILLVMAVAGFSALTGALAGGALIYRILQQGSANLPELEYKPGDQITLEVVRGNGTMQVEVTPGARQLN